MPSHRPTRTGSPRDQAHGLRQLFAGHAAVMLPLVHNPHVSGVGAVMERLCAAYAEQGLRTLVVDAADSASPPHELASVDLSACIEALSPQVSYLAARGLPVHYLDHRASMVDFLEALRGAARQVDLVLLHASALDLRRMFMGRTPRPVLLAGNRPDSLTHAYTSMKLLSQRLGALGYDLIVAGDVAPRRARKMADRLTECADHFLGAALRQVAVLDPLAPPNTPLPLDLLRLAASHVEMETGRKWAGSANPAAPRTGAAAGRLN